MEVRPLTIEEFPPPQREKREGNTDTYNIQSKFPRDLTGHVTKSSGFPVASGSYGDIYKGTLNVREGSIDVCYYLSSKEETKQSLGCGQDVQGVLAA